MRERLDLGHVVVIGGGCYGSWYTQQLARAAEKGALAVERVTVVDRDAECRVAQEQSRYDALPLDVATASWDAWLAQWLAGMRETGAARAAIVPSPLMPHLLLDWLLARAAQRWPDRLLSVEPLEAPPPMPWSRAAPDGRHYVSFAEWMCPVNCIEPARCPATRGPRDWSMPPAIARYAEAERARGQPLLGPIIFHCVHRTWGVGMIDAAALLAADDLVARAAADGDTRFLVGTVSHCHGALGVMRIQGTPPSPLSLAHVQDS